MKLMGRDFLCFYNITISSIDITNQSSTVTKYNVVLSFFFLVERHSTDTIEPESKFVAHVISKTACSLFRLQRYE